MCPIPQPRLAEGTQPPFATLVKVRDGTIAADQILQAVQESGLRGRGGAWFPVARKWQLARQQQDAGHRVVVGNGGEDEPGSVKDRFLLTEFADLVIEGLLLAAYAVDATDAFVYVNRLFDDARAAVLAAVAKAEDAGVVGGVNVRVVAAPDEYVAGEETAVLQVLEGQPALPRDRPPYPVASGYLGRPTVVNNVETLANIPAIVLNGAGWYRARGTPAAPGTMLFSVIGDVPRPGLYEMALGSPLRSLLVDHAGADPTLGDVQAIQVGGASSAYFTMAQGRDIKLDPDEMVDMGSVLGAGVVKVLGPGRCLLDEAIGLAEFFARECCGQCPPCRMETTSLLGMLRQVKAGKARANVLERATELLMFTADKGKCGFIRMPQSPFGSLFSNFRADFDAHLGGQPCRAAQPCSHALKTS